MAGRAGKLDFTCDLALEIGATFDGEIALKNDDDTAIDLTGFTLVWQVRDYASSAAVILDIAAYSTIPDPTNGTIIFSVPPSVTSLLGRLSAVTDIKLVSGDYATYELRGEFHIVETVSR